MKRSIIQPEAVSCSKMSSLFKVSRRVDPKKIYPAVLVLACTSFAVVTNACADSGHSSKGGLATPQTLSAKIAAAGPGETVLLAPGDYGPLAIRGKDVAAPGLTIAAAPGAKVTFPSIGIAGSEGITVQGVDVEVQAAPYGVAVTGSSRVTLSRLNVHAPEGAAPSAMMLRNDKDVTVEDCDIHDVGMGINMLDSDGLKIYRNTFTDLQVDAIRGASSNVEVTGNHASSFHPKAGDHPDFIQFWGLGPGKPSSGNVIKDNVYQRGDGSVVQGVFLEDNNDVVISGNAMTGTMYNGIGLARVQRAVVEDNFVQGYEDMGTRIITRGASTDVTIRNNVAQSIVTYNDGGKPNVRYKEEHNKSIGPAKVGDTSAMKAWLAKRDAR